MSEINGNISAVEQITGNLYPKGEKGNGIDRIERISRVGLVDTYSIYFTDGTSKTFTVTNGEKGDTGDTGPKGDPGDVSLDQLNTAVGNATKTTQTTEVSEELTITNCAGVKGKLDIKSGKSEQATREGYNILPNNVTTQNINGVDFIVNKDGTVLVNGTVTANAILQLNSGITYSAGTYKLSGCPRGGATDTYRFDLMKTSDNTIPVIDVGNGAKFTIIEETTFIPRIRIQSGVTINNLLFEPMLVSDISKTIYEPYGVSPSPDYPSRIRNVGDNIQLFDKSTITSGYRLSVTGEPNVSAETNYTSDFVPVDGNATYIRTNTVDAYTRWCFYDSSKAFISKDDVNQIITTPSNARYIRFSEYLSRIDTMKLEHGTKSTSPSEYGCGSVGFKVENKDKTKSKTVIFPLSQGQLLHKGDYLAKDGIYNERNTLILNGDETITNVSNSLTNTVRIYWKNIMTKSSTSIGSRLGFKSNMLIGKLNWDTDEVGGYIDSDGTSFIARLPKSLVGKTEDTVKAWLSQNPLTIEYRLATETITPYTTEQEEAYYELQHLLMYEGYTKIECIDEIKPDIQLTYLYNNELNKSYGERFDKVEENINELEKRDIYSTEEQVIGKWIDGKPLYSKVIDIGELPNATTKNVAFNISNLKNIIKMEGYARGSNYWLPIPYSNYITIMCNSSVIGITTTTDRSSCTGYVTLYYTKTTD